jgi:hypothetical protein
LELGREKHTLKVGHVGPDVRVQGVDDHLAVSGSSDLNTTVDHSGSRVGSPPGRVLTDVLGLGEEVRENSLVNLSLTQDTALEELLAGRVEGSVESGQESTCLLGEDLGGGLADGSKDLDVLEESVDLGRHCDGVYMYVLRVSRVS